MSIDEKRGSPRIPADFPAEIRSGNRCYKGVVSNISEHGIGYLTTSLVQLAGDVSPQNLDAEHLIGSLKVITNDFAPEKTVEVSFQTPSGDQIEVKCSPVWFSWNASKREAAMGMKIVDHSLVFAQFMKDLKEDQAR